MRHLKLVSSLLALGLLSLAACTDGPAPTAARPTTAGPATTGSATAGSATAQSAAPSPSASSALSPAALPASKGGKILARRDDQTGPWKATIGAKQDKGALDIEVVCAGGGFVSTEYGSGGVIKTPCDGALVNQTRDDAAPAGAVKLSVTPDGEQRWSIRVTRVSALGGAADQPEA
ncbi:hypothetical protein ACQPZJ_09220 [Actinoplanes sp. CA-054009]